MKVHVVIILLSIATYLIQVQRLCLYMRKNAPDEYQKIGQFDLFMNNSARSTMKFIPYLLSGEYRFAQLAEIRSKALAAHLLFYACLIILIAGVIFDVAISMPPRG